MTDLVHDVDTVHVMRLWRSMIGALLTCAEKPLIFAA